MKLVYRQVLRELVGPFFFGVMAFTSVTFAGTYLLKVTSWLMGGKIDILTALQFIMLVLPSVIVFTLPMSTLLSVLLGIGRLSSDSEMVALFAGGVSLYRVMVPVVVLGVLISAGAIALNEVVVPWAHQRQERIYAIISKEEAPKQRTFTVGEDNGPTVAVGGGIDAERGILKNVTITMYALCDQMRNGEQVQKGQPLWIVYAKTAQWEGLLDPSKRFNWRLHDGFAQELGTKTYDISSFSNTNTREQIINKTPGDFALYQKANQRNSDQMSFAELTQIVGFLKKHPDSRPPEQITELDVNRWNKLALPLSSLVFALLAAPLAIRPSRSSSSVGFGLSILLILIYWITWHFTSHLAIQGSLTPEVGAFTADVLGIVAAVVLLRRATK